MAKTKQNPKLLKIWKKRAKLRAEADKLWAEGDKLQAEGIKLRAEGDKLWAEGNKLWAEGILEVYGNIIIDWISVNECRLENGEVYKM